MSRFQAVDPAFAAGDLPSNIQAVLRVAVVAADNETANVDPATKIAALEKTVEVAEGMSSSTRSRRSRWRLGRPRRRRLDGLAGAPGPASGASHTFRVVLR